MSVLVYLISLIFSFPLLILGLALAKKLKQPFFYYFKIFSISIFSYLVISTIVFCISTNVNRNRVAVFQKENDGLIGCDRIELYSDNEFYIEFVDHHYYGTYTLNNNNLELDINWNPFLPFRKYIPSKLKIIEGKKIQDPETGKFYFGK